MNIYVKLTQNQALKYSENLFLGGNYMFKVNNRKLKQGVK